MVRVRCNWKAVPLKRERETNNYLLEDACGEQHQKGKWTFKNLDPQKYRTRNIQREKRNARPKNEPSKRKPTQAEHTARRGKSALSFPRRQPPRGAETEYPYRESKAHSQTPLTKGTDEK